MLMILARLVRSESFWAIVKVRSPHTGPEPGYPRRGGHGGGEGGHFRVVDDRLLRSCNPSCDSFGQLAQP